MSLIVSYNVSSCVCWRVWLLVETDVEWVWSLRGGLEVTIVKIVTVVTVVTSSTISSIRCDRA